MALLSAPAGAPSFATVRTREVDQAQAEVASLFCPHRLAPTERAPLAMELRACKLGAVGFVHLDYGAAVRIEPGALDTFYLVQLPLSGVASIRQGREELQSSRGVASVLSPFEDVAMTWNTGNPQTIVYIEAATMEARLARLLDRPLGAPLVFDLGMRTDSPAVASWCRAVEFLRDEVTHGSPFLDLASFARQVEELVVDRLLLAQPHNYTHLLSASAAVPRVVARAQTLMRDHHVEPLTVADVAEAVGVSVRALQEGFHDLGTTPTAYLRHCRLTAAHRDLEAGEAEGHSVAAVAMAHGFTHLGRFSGDYRRLYGRSPSATLAGRASA